jgi:hypothetical protein
MKTIETKVYEFNELSEDAKEKAREWYREGALDYEWYDYIYEDAENIGLKLTSFDLDRNRHAEGRFTMSGYDVVEKIIQKHGKDCETYKTAINFLSKYNELPVDEDDERNEDDIEDLENDFLKSLLEDYSIMLQHDYEYLLSDESVDENIIANEYTFTEDGKRF